jgi:CxxC-x17-CxxC domain-containing protein
MKPFNKGKKSGKKTGMKKNKRDFNRPYPGQGGGFERPYDSSSFSGFKGRGGGTELYQAICAECGEPCEVPFKPTGSRPVLCRKCFRQNEGGGSDDRFSGRDSRRKPRDRGGERRGGEQRDREHHGGNDLALQLADINRKLDLIMEALEID